MTLVFFKKLINTNAIKKDIGTFSHPEDKKSTMTAVEFYINQIEIIVQCTDWSKKYEAKNYTDNIRIEISSKEFSDFLRNEAY